MSIAGSAANPDGHTTPSVTGVKVVGDDGSDYAIAVHFEGCHETIWFARHLLEFIDHAPGTCNPSWWVLGHS